MNKPAETGGSGAQTATTASPDELGDDDSKGKPASSVPREDTDNRGLFQPKSKYPPEYISDQRIEGMYVFALLALSLLALGCIGLGFVDRLFARWCVDAAVISDARKYEWICAGGLLGGTVYAAKWLYHAIAKGLWHEDRRTWRYLSPWISLGTTVGVGALLDAGFFRSSVDQLTTHSGASLTGMGFLIGYLSDRFLAKMKEVTQVIFGETEWHFKRQTQSPDKESKDP